MCGMQSELAASGLRGFHLVMQLVAAPVLARTQRERARERGNRFESEVGAQSTDHKCNVVGWAGGGAQSLDLYVFSRIWMRAWMHVCTGRIYASMHTRMDVDCEWMRTRTGPHVFVCESTQAYMHVWM